MARENPADKLIRMTAIEGGLWRQGLIVAGIDEVGRGPLAGPVVAACVIMSESALVPGVDDSKKLSPARREALAKMIAERADYMKICCVEAGEIDAINILGATRRAMEQCAADARADVFLVDAVTGLHLPGAMQSLIHGDTASYMIAAASIVAKVYRDRLMEQMDARYPGYGFARNKGYGTAQHIAALRELGPCAQHRRSFIGKILGRQA
jgi:ribonuclease HII